MSWTVLVGVIVSVITALSGVLLGWLGRASAAKKDVETEAAEDAALRLDVDYIKRGVDNIQLEQKAMRTDMSRLSDRVTRVEESSKQAHKRIDEIVRGDRT